MSGTPDTFSDVIHTVACMCRCAHLESSIESSISTKAFLRPVPSTQGIVSNLTTHLTQCSTQILCLLSLCNPNLAKL